MKDMGSGKGRAEDEGRRRGGEKKMKWRGGIEKVRWSNRI